MNIATLLTFFLKLLTDKIDKKWLWLALVVIGFPYCLKNLSPPSYELFIDSTLKSIMIIETYSFRICCFIILVIVGYILLRKSHSVFCEELKRRHPKHKVYEADKDRFILTTVSEDREYTDGNRTIRRQITIKNKLDTEIKYVKGKISFFENRIRIFDVPFEEKNIARYDGVRIHNNIDSDETHYWNEFRISIEKLKYNDVVEENIDLHGLMFIRNYSWLFNRYNYRIFGIIRVRYELSWIKEQWGRKIKPWLIHYPRLPRMVGYRGCKQSFKKRMECFWERKLNQFIWVLVIAPTCAFLYLAFSGFALVSWNILQIWFHFTSKLFLEIYN